MGGFDSAPKPLEIHLSGFVVRRIDTYVEKQKAPPTVDAIDGAGLC